MSVTATDLGYCGKIKTWYLLILLLILACEEPERLDGRWHLYNLNDSPSAFTLLDIEDTVAIWGRGAGGSGISMKVDKDKKFIQPSIPELSSAFAYQVRGDSLILRDPFANQLVIGVRGDQDSRRFETEYFAEQLVDIQLPELPDTTHDPDQMGRMNFILFVGKPKEGLQVKYGDTVRIESSRGLISLSTLWLSNEKHDVKIPEKLRSGIRTLIFADENVSMSHLSRLVAIQQSINDRDIFLVGKRKLDAGEEVQVGYVLLEEQMVFAQTDRVKDWINGR
ncbi:MAG: hypothetical protein AAFV25_12245 [Bacteroidota bacterium]